MCSSSSSEDDEAPSVTTIQEPEPPLMTADTFIQHIASINTTTKKSYHKFLPVIIRNVACSALVDSGNTWRTAISESFARKLGINKHHIQPLPNIKVKTAQENGRLDVIGETKDVLTFNLPTPRQIGEPNNIAASFKCRPAIIRDLGMDLNISGPFLKHFNIDQLHSKNCLQLPNGIRVPLTSVPSTQPKRHHEQAEFVALITKNVTVPPLSISHVKIHLPNLPVSNNTIDGIIEGNQQIIDQTGLIPWSAAVITAKSKDTRAGLINTTHRPLRIKAGQRYGSFTRICTVEEQDITPWRIACVSVNQDQDEEEGHTISSVQHFGATHKPTVQEKLRQIIDAKAKTTNSQDKAGTQMKTRTEEEKREWLRQSFRLKENKLLNTPAIITQVEDLLLEFWDTISINGEYGQTDLVEHEIHTGDAAPIKCRNRPINPILEVDLKKQIDDNLHRGVIEPSNSPWSFPLVAAPKKNGKIRWCVDYRRLNAVTRKDNYPLPHIEDNIARLSKAKVFSCLDGSGAFHVIPVRPQDRPKTAFSTPYGLFQYKRVPFGLCNGPATYSRLIQLALGGIPLSIAIPYLDDIIVLSEDIPSHLKHLRQVLQVHRKAGLKLQPSKCFIFQEEVEYLGHLVSKHGVKVIPSYVQIVKDWPFPQTKSEVRIFLGKVGYYRRFIKNYSAIARPLTDVSGKGSPEEEKTPIDPDQDKQEAFTTLKEKLTTAPILAYPQFDSDEPFILDTDWCQDTNSIGGVLSQKQDGKERVIQYGGKKMSAAQKNYDPFKGELAALLHFAKKWKYYLQYRPFILRTDHAPLTFMNKMQPQDRHTLRMLSTLADLNFEIKHRKGTSHGNADAISRAPHLRDAPDAEEDVGTDPDDDQILMIQFICNIEQDITDGMSKDQETDANITQELPFPHTALYSSQAMKILQEDDEDIAPVLTSMRKKEKPSTLELSQLSPESRIYFGMWENLCLGEDGLLRLRRIGSHTENRTSLLCLPRETWDPITYHVHRASGHSGVENTVDRLSRNFYFPRMKAEVQDLLLRCEACQRKQSKPKPQKHTLISQLEGYPFQRLAVDFVGPLDMHHGQRYIFTVRDTFSKWLEAFPTPAPTTEHAMNKLVNEVFKRFGMPETIHSDRGTHFTSHKFTEALQALGIRRTNTPPYHPQSNPVERVHEDIKNMLRALAIETGQNWVNCLPAAVMAINTNRHKGTQYSPFRVLFGRDPPFPLDLAYRLPEEDEHLQVNTDVTSYVSDLKQRLQAAFHFVRENLQAAVERRRQSYHQSAHHYKPNDKVFFHSGRPENPQAARKLQIFWTGPWTIRRQVTPVLYEIEAPPHWKNKKQQIQTVGVDRIKPYHGGTEIQMKPNQQVEEPGDPFGERPSQYRAALPTTSANKPPPRFPPSDHDSSSDDDDRPDIRIKTSHRPMTLRSGRKVTAPTSGTNETMGESGTQTLTVAPTTHPLQLNQDEIIDESNQQTLPLTSSQQISPSQSSSSGLSAGPLFPSGESSSSTEAETSTSSYRLPGQPEKQQVTTTIPQKVTESRPSLPGGEIQTPRIHTPQHPRSASHSTSFKQPPPRPLQLSTQRYRTQPEITPQTNVPRPSAHPDTNQRASAARRTLILPQTPAMRERHEMDIAQAASRLEQSTPELEWDFGQQRWGAQQTDLQEGLRHSPDTVTPPRQPPRHHMQLRRTNERRQRRHDDFVYPKW